MNSTFCLGTYHQCAPFELSFWLGNLPRETCAFSMPTRLYIWLVHIRNAGDCKFTSHEKIRIAGILICWQSNSTNGLFHVPGILTCSRTSIGPMLKSCWKYGSRILNAREITCVGLSRYATFSYRLCINNSKHWMVRFYVSVFNDIHRLKWNERV